MTNDAKTLPLLSVRSAALDLTKPFADDLFDRQKLAERLTGWIDRLPEGGVLAIDAPWGDGKSWFGRNWHASLIQGGRRSIYIDAFASDYIADPFLLLAAELADLWKSNMVESSEWRSRAVKVGKVLLPVVAKGVVRAAISAMVGKETAGAIENAVEGAGDATGDVLTASLKTYLDELESREKSVDALKSLLANTAATSENPIVVFIDELDRCRPDFAMTLLERVKHFFEVPGVVFVLLVNRAQLEGTIHATYGAQIDATAYLHRFITLFVSLPKNAGRYGSDGFTFRFLVKQGERLGYQNREGFRDFCNTLASFATAFRLSYRDCERALGYFGLAGPVSTTADVVAYLITLRVARPTLFKGLLEGDARRFSEASDELRRLFPGLDGAPWVVERLLALFTTVVAGDSATEEDVASAQELNRGRPLQGGEFIKYWAGRLDLDIQ